VTNRLDRLSDPSESAFQSLFNGYSLVPWRMAGPPGFSVVDGTLEAHGGMGLLWYPERQFGDFVLRLEWMVHRPEDNSGVFLRFPDPDDDPWIAVNQGYEVQIHDEGRDDQHTGAIYEVAKPIPYTPKPVGEWNSMEVQVVGQRYVVILNGDLVNDFTGAGDRGLEGFVGLQNHDDQSRVRFRNVRIKSLE
jgi:Domain of Unknown Function (DUF1080)